MEDQLLAQVVGEEAAELEKQKQDLTDSFNRYKIQLLTLENQLLERLANAPDDILSDINLIEGLEQTKATSKQVKIAVKKGKEMEVNINKSRELYRPAC